MEGIQGTMKMHFFGCPTKFKANAWQLVKDKYEIEKEKKNSSNWHTCFKLIMLQEVWLHV